MGRRIPAGTGFEWYRQVRIPSDEPPPVSPQPAEDDRDREIEYAFDTDKPMLGRPPAGLGETGSVPRRLRGPSDGWAVCSAAATLEG